MDHHSSVTLIELKAKALEFWQENPDWVGTVNEVAVNLGEKYVSPVIFVLEELVLIGHLQRRPGEDESEYGLKRFSPQCQ
jgi:hypothetical protein